MKKYGVSIPLTGYIYIEVEADSEQAAEEAAWEKFNVEGEKAGDIAWELVDHVTTGNVFHGELNDVCVDEIKPT